jgi:hypothetical protein
MSTLWHILEEHVFEVFQVGLVDLVRLVLKVNNY